jgi:preprotein translocase subunit YajC
VNPTGLVLIAIAFFFVWFAILRPQKRQRAAQAEMWQSLSEGDEIVTAGGLYGEITGFRGDDVLVRIAPELEVRVARRAIAGSFPPDSPGEEQPDASETEDPESYSGSPRE